MFQSCCNRKKIITLNCVCIHGKQLAEKEAGSLVSKCNECKSDTNILPQSLHLRWAHSILEENIIPLHSTASLLKYSTSLCIMIPN